MDAAKEHGGRGKGRGGDCACKGPSGHRRKRRADWRPWIAIGAIIAAALPQTKAEAKVMGQASDSVKQAAEAAQSGFWAAKDATMSAADAAAKASPRPISAATPAA